MNIAPIVVAASFALLITACGHVGFVNNERPGLSGTNAVAHTSPQPEESDESNGEEPEHPLVDTKEQRAMVHIHAGDTACAGVALGPRLVATSRRCLKHAQGVHSLEKKEVRVELPSSSLTWTQRAGSHVLVPGCERRDFDVALIVLAEPATWLEPLAISSAPGPGATVDALGFDKCEGKGTKRAHVIDRSGPEVVIDRVLCSGDMGGPVIDAGQLVGIQSHRKGPRESPRKETSVTRFDSTPMRDLVAQAKSVVEGADVATMKPVACAAR